MKRELNKGEKCSHEITVVVEDTAIFYGEAVHPIYSTFALARDAEYTTRQFILIIADDDEEGIGTSLEIEHSNSAFVGDRVTFEAEVVKFEKKKLICTWVARVNEEMIASGTTGQKLLKKAAIKRLLTKKQNER